MRFYNTQHPFYCGIDLHARNMYVCILDQAGETLLPRNLQTHPETFLQVMAPYRDGLVVAVEWMVPWYWLADLCADAGRPCVLGHALSRQALQGGQAKNDQIASRKIAVVLRGGMLPQAYVSPAAMRATRALLRRRRHLAPTRGARLAHVQQTTSQYTLPAIGKKRAYQANRDGVAQRCADPAGQKRIDVDRARLGSADEWRRAVARTLRTTAQQQDAHTLHLRQTVPGIGKMLSRVLRYASHQSARFPRGQEVAAVGRLVTGAQAANGQRSGTSGSQMGHAHLTWACAAAAVFFLRDHPAAQPYRSRLAKQHDTGQAWTLFAHQ